MVLIESSPKKIYIRVDQQWWQPWANTLLYLPFVSDMNDHSWNWNNPTSSSNAIITTLDGVNCCFLNQWRIVLPAIWAVFNSIFTVAWWINITGTKWNGFNCIMASWTYGAYNAFGLTWYYKTGQNDFGAWYCAWASVAINTPSYSWGWRHFLATLDANKKLVLYMNWSEVDSTTSWTPHINDNTVYIWVNTEVPNDTSRWSYCYLSDLILEDKARTAQEVSDYFDQTKSLYWIN